MHHGDRLSFTQLDGDVIPQAPQPRSRGIVATLLRANLGASFGQKQSFFRCLVSAGSAHFRNALLKFCFKDGIEVSHPRCVMMPDAPTINFAPKYKGSAITRFRPKDKTHYRHIAFLVDPKGLGNDSQNILLRSISVSKENVEGGKNLPSSVQAAWP